MKSIQLLTAALLLLAALPGMAHAQLPTAPAAKPFEVGLNALLAFGGSSEDDAALANLQRGGHDPSRNGSTMRNVELIFSGTVDPNFDAQANVVFLIDAAGETVIELEEAFLTTRALPAGLQVKVGQHYTEFGRLNVQHPHAWAFVDQPLILSRFFGPDNPRSQGERLAWLTPLPWYSEFYLGAQNANGETVVSFLYEPMVGGGARGIEDLLWSARWLRIGNSTPLLSIRVADHVTVGSQAVVFAQSGVTKDIAAKDQVMGFPAVNRKEWLHEMAAQRRLAGNQKALEELVRLLPKLRDAVSGK